jgi:hypothetical protein
LENIHVYLNSFSSSAPIFFHNFDVFPRETTHYVDIEDKSRFPMSIMSKKALDILKKTGYSECLLKYKDIPSMETIVVRCMEDFGVKVVSVQGFHSTEPSNDFAWPENPCQRPLSISNLSRKQMESLFQSRPTTGKTSDQVSYTWDTIVTYSDIFHNTFGSKTPTPNIDRHASKPSVTKKAKSGMECLKLCEADKKCVSWTFDNPKCHMSNSVGVSIPRKGIISGIINTRYICSQ